MKRFFWRRIERKIAATMEKIHFLSSLTSITIEYVTVALKGTDSRRTNTWCGD